MPAILIGFLFLLIASTIWLYQAWTGLNPDRPWFEFVALMQTGLGALIGFYGLMLVEAARVRNEKRLGAARRRQEAQEIGSMLDWEIGKLLGNLSVIRNNLNGIKEDVLRNAQTGGGELTVSLTVNEIERSFPPPTPIFSSVVARLGMKELEAVRQPIGLFYEKYEETRATALSELGRTERRGLPLSHLDAVLTPVNQAVEFGKAAKSALGQFLPANQRLIDDRSLVRRLLARQRQSEGPHDSWNWTGRKGGDEASRAALS